MAWMALAAQAIPAIVSAVGSKKDSAPQQAQGQAQATQTGQDQPVTAQTLDQLKAAGIIVQGATLTEGTAQKLLQDKLGKSSQPNSVMTASAAPTGGGLPGLQGLPDPSSLLSGASGGGSGINLNSAMQIASIFMNKGQSA